MTVADTRKAPFPWPGGKRRAAPAVWEALGDVTHYVEPFFGTGAVLLNRPHEPNRTYYSETVGDADGWIVNFWRAVVGDPDGVAEWASWPVTEADKHARLCWLLANPPDIDRLCGDPEWFDVKRAGWWVQSVCLQIGDWPGPGPWWPDEDGRLRRWKRGEERPGVSRELPHLADDGKGVNHPGLREPGVSRELPHLGNDGQGVNHPGLREPGVSRELPHLGNDGRGVNHPGLREPGVSRELPHLGDDGRGVNHPGLREPGVSRKLPHLGDDGKGVNSAAMREPGVSRKLPHLSDNGRGVNHPSTREPGIIGTGGYHPMVMPELRRWLAALAARLRHVRVVHGDWRRTVGTGAALTLSVRQGKSPCGVFLDPPYAGKEGSYSTAADGVAVAAAEWAVGVGDDPRWRVVAAGYADDDAHGVYEAAGWRTVEWYTAGHLTGGYKGRANGGDMHGKARRERLYLSPHCLTAAEDPETTLPAAAGGLW